MVYFVQFTILLITLLVTQELEAKQCSQMWFGERCMYRCMCLADVQCDDRGYCPDNKCLGSYFGPGCQFYDRGSASTTAATARYLVDRNNNTCNLDVNATSVQVSLYPIYLFMWFRIEVQNERNILNFNALLNNRIPCLNMQKSRGTKMVEVTCENKIFLQTLIIEGPIAPDVCSILISGGRNVAVRQDTRQSSSWRDYFSVDSSNAVDFSHLSTLEGGSCATTAVQNDPWWKIIYNRPQHLLALFITNRNMARERLSKFRLLAVDKSGSMVFEYTNNQSLGVYQVPGAKGNPVTEMTITGHNHPTYTERVLTLCEVETFGETVCPDGTYGLWCQDKCQCHGTQICSPVNGLCAPGCSAGFYGFACASPCRQTCRDNLCTNTEGKCLLCKPGKEGDYCENDCQDGYYGDNCETKCSPHCKDVCDYVTGECTCQGDFGGATCTDCVDGVFGEDCTDKCPTTCKDQKCNSTTGECPTCDVEYLGRFCTGEVERVESGGFGSGWIIILLISCLTVAVCGTLLLCGKRKDGANQEQ